MGTNISAYALGQVELMFHLPLQTSLPPCSSPAVVTEEGKKDIHATERAGLCDRLALVELG